AVEGALPRPGHRHADDFEAWAVNVRRVAERNVVQRAEPIDPAADSVVGATHQGQAVFHGAKRGAARVLPLRGAFAEPAVVGDVYEKVHVLGRMLAGVLGKNILET